MRQNSKTPAADPQLASLLQQLHTFPPDVRAWPLSARVTLLRGGLIDLTITSPVSPTTPLLIASVPKYALMAVSAPVLTHLAVTNPHAPAVHFALSLAPAMSAASVARYTAALRRPAHWLNVLCTAPGPGRVPDMPLRNPDDDIRADLALRHLAAHMQMSLYVRHIADKYIASVRAATLTPADMTAISLYGLGADDPLLLGVARELVRAKREGRVLGVAAEEELLGRVDRGSAGAATLALWLLEPENRKLAEVMGRLEGGTLSGGEVEAKQRREWMGELPGPMDID
ncbi:hypothetical protein BDV95DRAFT_280849 [Massariosphaeria phaeospora]|uniref:Uncharacterized protein n=1 Tax=Massariosphaeria phaeospora TaxID=100035 RepID=A0A7C8IFS8_9PLEO|nr:hypothetical protein BDV95DRAFT_280849 [Massariosphaeria phaeospora]